MHHRTSDRPLTPPGAERSYVSTAVGGLGVLHAGAPIPGRYPIVLVHGGGTDSSSISWYRLVEPLAADREVWAVDLPGFGTSMDLAPVGGPGAMADVLAETLAALGVGPAAVCGVSMGGDVALNLALSHPERVVGLVLIAPGGLVPSLGSAGMHRAAWLAAQLPDRVLLPAGRLANRFVRAAQRAIVKDPARLPAEVVEEFARLARDPRGVLGYARYNQATLGRDRMLNNLTERVQEIGVPALFFHGADDPIVDPEGSRRAAELMPRARLVLVPDCGHWAQLERHDEFLAQVHPFLTEMDRGATPS
ncbi:alpha/beta hydrolase [Kocuria sp. CCUG 69068]|uniref:alpha/beta fold hydrolase n=1 Tax=Kocuria sp. CCUG 69068 TaxID=2043138 RepID=UPI001E63FF7C|nr:alpha/beta hydrolase [Kocuria sp. CCUG 69068]